MRVSSNTQYIMGTFNLQNKQFQLTKLGEQLSTLKRINRASDDPVASASLVEIRQSKDINAQQAKNAEAASTQLAISDTVLRQVATSISSIKTLAVQAGNGSLNNQNRQAIQNEMRERVKELVSLANSTDGNGNYLFGGTSKGQPPFSLTFGNTAPNIAIDYHGNDQRQYMAISPGRDVAITEPGAALFGVTSAPPAASGNELLQALTLFDESLVAGPAGSATYAADIGKVMSGLDAGLSRMLAGQASLGARMQEADALKDAGDALNIQYATQASNLEDLDLAKAVSDREMAKMALEVSQKTYSQVKGLSLFNYI